MAQNYKVRGVKTSIRHEGLDTVIRYHSTDVVRFNRERVILKSGGWETNTTKARMNQASNQFNLGYGIYQKNFEWFITFRNRELKFYDGIEINFTTEN